jgi:hypothetical protein
MTSRISGPTRRGMIGAGLSRCMIKSYNSQRRIQLDDMIDEGGSFYRIPYLLE